MIPAMSPEMFARPQQRPHPMAVAHVGGSARAWYEDPLAIGSLLILMPPMGLAVLWTSKRYSNDARWALTVMTALMMCLGAAVFLAALALR